MSVLGTGLLSSSISTMMEDDGAKSTDEVFPIGDAMKDCGRGGSILLELRLLMDLRLFNNCRALLAA